MMDITEIGELDCTVTVESLNSCGIVTRRRTYKNITVVLGRDEFRDLILRIIAKASPLGKSYRLREIAVHKRFLKEGKATIKLTTQGLQLLLSNCPPTKLHGFLKCIALKLEQKRENGFASERTRMRSDLPKAFQIISPLVEKDDAVGQSQSRKRPLGDSNSNGLTPKRCKRESIINDGPRKKLNIISSTQTKLNPEQLAVIQSVRAGKSVFFTGSAGTGKSFLLRRLIGMLPPQGTFVTASTGAAACHVGGTTLHAFAGIGSGSGNVDQCIELASRPGRIKMWKSCKRLIIDEVSMIDAELFDKLNAVAKGVRHNERPFGGIQLILSGDFLQLPPVSKLGEGKTKKFCFEADSWQECIQATVELTQVYRQRNPMFISILQNIRVGSCPEQVLSKLEATRHNKIEKDGILATKLCTHKENVDQINEIHLSKLPGKSQVFMACDSDTSQTKALNNQVPVPQKLELRVGAQVMLVKNLDVTKGLVNGARGIVKGFDTGNCANPIVKFTCGEERVMSSEKWITRTPGGQMITRRQLPLKLAWAVSIHKSQGMTLDCVEISLARVFEYGQAYVALSRARNLEGLRVLDFDKKCVRAHPDVLRFYGRLRREQKMMAKMMIPIGREDDKENICW